MYRLLIVLGSLLGAWLCLMQSQAYAVVNSETSEQQVKKVKFIASNWLKRPELQHSLIGLEIMHVPSRQIVFSFNNKRRFVPASVVKILTTACVFELLGPDYRFKTRLLADGSIQNGTLQGNLVIMPSQDPSLQMADIKEMFGALKEKGIKDIAGNLTVASPYGGGDKFLGEWLVEDWGQDWVPPSSSLVLDRNTVLSSDPARGYPLVAMSADHELTTLTRSLLLSAWSPAWVSFNKTAQSVYVWRGVKPLVGAMIVANPEEYNLAVMKSLLKTIGVFVKGKHLASKEYRDMQLLAEHWSKPLSSLIKYTLKESDNLYAQQFLRVLGTLPAANKHLERLTLEEKGLVRLALWLSSVGVQANEVVLYDGCGLSRKNCLTPHALNMVLSHMSGSNNAFLELLLHEGANKNCSKTFHFKTGAMDSVRAISGIVTTSRAEPFAVSILINAHSPSVKELRASLNNIIVHLEALDSMPQLVKREKKEGVKSAIKRSRSKVGTHKGKVLYRRATRRKLFKAPKAI